MSVIAGQPTLLRDRAEELVRSAALIQSAADDLRLIAVEGKSVALDQARSLAVDTATQLDRAHTRYAGTATALKVYAVVLGSAQVSADEAYQEYNSLRYSIGLQEQRVASQERGYRTLQSADMPSAAIEAARAAWQESLRQLDYKRQALAAAVERVEVARSQVEEAAQQAIRSIDTALDDTNDSFWDGVKAFFEGVGDFLAAVATWVRDVLTVILVAIVAVLALVAAALLLVVALLLAAALLVVALAVVLALVAVAALLAVVAVVVAVALALVALALALALVAVILMLVTSPVGITVITIALVVFIAKDYLQTVEVAPFDAEAAAAISQRSAGAYEKNAEIARHPSTNVNDLFKSVPLVDGMGGDGATRDECSVVDIKQMPGPPPTWVVTFPSTQDLFNGAPNDWMHNVPLKLFSPPTAYERAVMQAMRDAGIGPEDKVMVMGFSQGGIMAARLATNPNSGFNVTGVLTAGSPIHDIKIPLYSTQGDPVNVVSIQHPTDPVPYARNPLIQHDGTNPQWHNFTPGDPRKEDGSGTAQFVAAHDPRLYANTLKDLTDSPEGAGISDLFADFYGKPVQHTLVQFTE